MASFLFIYIFKEVFMNKAIKFLKRNSATILTFLGTVGVVATTASAIKATPKAYYILEKAAEEKDEELNKMEVVKKIIPIYAPTMLLCVGTIVSIVGANILSKRQQAALTTAYALLNRTYTDYKNKTIELCGPDTHARIMEEIAKSKVETNPNTHIYTDGIVGQNTLDFDTSSDPEIVRTFYDHISNRYFESTISKVLQAEYHLNRNFLFSGTAALNDFYDFLGIPGVKNGDEIGWNGCNGDIYWIDFNHYKTVLDDGMEIYVIESVFTPEPDYDEVL